VATKLLIPNDTASTFIFFMMSIGYIAVSYGLYLLTASSPFIQYYMDACKKIVLRPDEDRVSPYHYESHVTFSLKSCFFSKTDTDGDSISKFGVLSLNSNDSHGHISQTEGLSFR
jgi:hypothetical protein